MSNDLSTCPTALEEVRLSYVVNQRHRGAEDKLMLLQPWHCRYQRWTRGGTLTSKKEGSARELWLLLAAGWPRFIVTVSRPGSGCVSEMCCLSTLFWHIIFCCCMTVVVIVTMCGGRNHQRRKRQGWKHPSEGAGWKGRPRVEGLMNK